MATQTLKADEIVVVQDGPITKGLEAVIENFEKILPIHSVKLEKNLGLSNALNIGLQHCKNEWVARFDTDDIALPNRLEVQAKEIINNPEVDIIGSWAITINERGEKQNLLKVPMEDSTIKRLVWTCPMIHPTVCYKKDKILQIGGYNPDAGPRQDDYDLWFRCVAAGYYFQNIPEPLLLYRFTDLQIRNNTLKVGYYRLKTGFRGNRMVKASPIAYVGVMIPFFRALLPYPLNIWFYKAVSKLNPRNR